MSELKTTSVQVGIMAKKKKMTKAQAAAARKDTTLRKREYGKPVDSSGPKDAGSRTAIIVTVASLVLVAVVAAVYAVPTLMG